MVNSIKTMSVGAWAIFKWIIKHWYLIILFLVILPTVFDSVKFAVENKNPSYPFLQLGIHLTNADAQISKDVDILITNPTELIGMERPTKGIVEKAKYGWFFFYNVIWHFFGLVWLISFPFVIFYKIFRIQGSKGFQSSKSADFMKALIFGLIFIFVINLVIVIHGLIQGNTMLTIPENMTFIEESWFIIKSTMPFHGIIKLAQYIFSLAV